MWSLGHRGVFPQDDHVEVIVAEDITSRFLNVISLFNGFIPLVAIQLRALQTGEVLTLSATKVLDHVALGAADDDDEIEAVTDRAYWELRSTKASVELADRLLARPDRRPIASNTKRRGPAKRLKSTALGLGQRF